MVAFTHEATRRYVCVRSLLLSLSLIIIFWPVKLYIFHYNPLAPFQQRGGRY